MGIYVLARVCFLPVQALLLLFSFMVWCSFLFFPRAHQHALSLISEAPAILYCSQHPPHDI
jgi:hypothetical protein